MQEKKVFKNLLQMFKKTVSISFKISSLLLLVIILSYSVSALPQFKWNFTSTVEGWTNVLFTDGGTVSVENSRLRMDTATTYYKGLYRNLTDEFGIEIYNKFPINLSIDVYLGSQYAGIGLTNISSGLSNMEKMQMCQLLPAGQSYCMLMPYATEHFNCGSASGIGVGQSRLNMYWLNETHIFMYDDGSLLCDVNWSFNPITTHTQGIAFFWKNDAAQSNRIDNVSIEYYDYVCVEDYLNGTWSEWEHQTECSGITNLQQHNRSLISVDQNECSPDIVYYEYQNLTCYTCDNLYNENKVNNMFIGLIILYVTFLALGVYMLRQGNKTAGFMLFGITIPIDFLIVEELYTYFIDGNVIDSTWQSAFIWIFGIGLMFWLLAKISVPLIYKWKG